MPEEYLDDHIREWADYNQVRVLIDTATGKVRVLGLDPNSRMYSRPVGNYDGVDDFLTRNRIILESGCARVRADLNALVSVRKEEVSAINQELERLRRDRDYYKEKEDVAWKWWRHYENRTKALEALVKDMIVEEK